MPHYAAFHLGLRCFPKHPFWGVCYIGLGTRPWTTDSQARAQRLSAANHKVTWSILIGFKYSTARVKQRLPVCKGNGHCKRNVSVLENSYFWRVIDHKYQDITFSCVLCVEIKTTFFHCSLISYAIIKADTIRFACPQKSRQHF